jgi:SAM-dependent methyltransferase
MSQSQTGLWGSGDAYEPYVGRWSRLVAREFVSWLAVPAGGRWLDVGCGTGALSECILRDAAPAQLTGAEPSEAYLAHARKRLPDARASFVAADAQALPFAPARYDAVVSGLVLNFLPDPSRGLAEMANVARPGAIVAAYVWDYAGQMQLMRHFWDAAVALDPGAAELDEGRRFPLCRPGPLVERFRAAGLTGVAVRAIDVATDFRDFADYWSPFLGGQGPAPAYAMSLSEDRREALRERIRASLPAAADGAIRLVARAWAVRGRR